MKCALFETFIPDGESVVVPVEDFQFITPSVEKDKEGWRERITLQTIPNDTEQAVERLAHVDGIAVEEDGNVRRQSQHGFTSNEWTSSAIS